jgi:hypothetical protein
LRSGKKRSAKNSSTPTATAIIGIGRSFISE